MKRSRIVILASFLLLVTTLSTAVLVFADPGEEAPPLKPQVAPTPTIDWANVKMDAHHPVGLSISGSLPSERGETDMTTSSDNEIASEVWERIEMATAPEEIFITYTVRAGDSLYRIARRHEVSLDVLAELNGIANRVLIHPGMELKIPLVTEEEITTVATPALVAAEPAVVDGETYIVQKGDTIYRIARRFGLSPAVLAAANHLPDPDRLKIGQVLTLLGEAPAASTAVASVAPSPNGEESNQYYIVQRGDSLYKIARRFGTTVQALADSNNIPDPHRLPIGLRLFLPSSAIAQETLPVVPKEGEFIWPVSGRNISQYYRYGHRAIDITMDTGSTVVAVAGGVVEFSGWNHQGYGNLIIIDHGTGMRTLYAHNSTLLVETGQTVRQGERIAASGSTGYASGPHLHFELLMDSKLMNPCLYLPGGC